MPQKIRESLYDLIKSLTKAEKRYFKVFASRHTIGEENAYARLFDYLEKQPEYNEERLFEHFSGEAFLNRFSITKKRLYDQVLASLDAFHAANSTDAQLYRMLHAADILFEKSLYDQSERLLRSAEKLATKFDRQSILLEISRKVKRAIENQGYKDVDHEHWKELYEKDQQRLLEIGSYDTLWYKKSALFTELNKKGVARSAEEKAYFVRALQDLPSDDAVDQGFELRYLTLHTRSTCFFATGQWKECLESLKSLLDLFRTHPYLLEDKISAYFSTLTNLIFVTEKTGNSLESLQFLKLLKRIPFDHDLSNKEDLRIKLFSSTVSIELEILTRRGDLSHARKQLTFVLDGLDRYSEKISVHRKSFILLKMAVVCMGLNEWNLSRKLVAMVLNDPESDRYGAQLANAYFLGLLMDIETGNTELFGYAVKNLQRYLRSIGRYDEHEQVILQELNKVARAGSTLEREEQWAVSYQKMSLNPAMAETFEFIDLCLWAEARSRQLSFEKVLQQKWEDQHSDKLSQNRSDKEIRA